MVIPLLANQDLTPMLINIRISYPAVQLWNAKVFCDALEQYLDKNTTVGIKNRKLQKHQI